MNKPLAVAFTAALLPLLLPSQQAVASSQQPVIGPTVTAVQEDWSTYPALMVEEANLTGGMPTLKAKVKDAQARQAQARQQEAAVRDALTHYKKVWPQGVPTQGERVILKKRATLLHSIVTDVQEGLHLPLQNTVKTLDGQLTLLTSLEKVEAAYKPKQEALAKANQALTAAEASLKAAEAKVVTLTQRRQEVLKRVNNNLMAAVVKDRPGATAALLSGSNAATLSPIAWAQLSSPLCSPVAPTAANGLLPNTALCYIGVKSHMLRPEAARSYVALATAYEEHFKAPLCITDSYRPLREQVSLKAAKPRLAAKPGTSNHGWGMAVDLCGGIENFGTPQHQWLQQNALAYGFYHPQWAEPTGSKPEPWHWEFVATSGA